MGIFSALPVVAVGFLILLASPAFSRTLELTDDNFEEEISKQPSFVMFFAPWCGYCKQVKPDWEKLTEAYAKEKNVLIGAVDCDTHKETATKYGISGFPTIKFLNGDDPIPYEGERNLESFVQFVNEKTGLSVRVKKEIDPVRDLDSDSFKAAIGDSKKSQFVIFYAAWCGHCKALMPVLPKLVESFVGDDTIEIVKIDAAKHADVGANYGVEGYPTLKLFLASGEEKTTVPFNSGREPQDMLNFINKHAGTHRTLDGGFDTGAWPSEQMEKLVAQFRAADKSEKASIIEKAEQAAKSATGRFAKFAHFYPKLMKKATDKPTYLDTEPERLQKLLQNKMGEDPKLNALYRLTILKQLKGITEPDVETTTDDEKDEL